MIEAVVYLLVMAAAEAAKTLLALQWGILCHIAILFAIIVRSALKDEYAYHRLILPLVLVPLMGIISVAVPQLALPQIWLSPAIYALLLAPAVVIVRILGYRAVEIGLTSKWLGMQLVIGGTGILLALLGSLILKPEPLIADFTWPNIWPQVLILLLCTGFIEEFVFRGVIQYGVVEVVGGWGIVYVGLLSAILYIGVSPGLRIIFLFIIFLYFGWVVKKTNSIWGVALAHGICNITLYLIFPFFF